MPEVKPEIQTFAKIKVIGVGGGGGSAINRMAQSDIKGIEFIAVNTDLQALQSSMADEKVHIGKSTTRGLGSGMNPEMGKKSAEESQNELREVLKGADMVFITCGLGGGTGSGAGPKVAEIAKELGALTIAVVTKPFSFEGVPRKKIAGDAMKEFKGKVDTLITIPNDRIWQIIDKKTPLAEAFGVVDEVLRQGVQGIAELITLPGLINVDFADVKTIMSDSGAALMGIGESSGDNRAIEAAKAAIASPLLELSMEGAKGLLFTITGGPDLAMYEVSEAAKTITEAVDDDAKIIFGAVIDENMQDSIKITVVATGFEEDFTTSPVLTAPKSSIPKSAPNYFAAKPINPLDEEEEKEDKKEATQKEESSETEDKTKDKDDFSAPEKAQTEQPSQDPALEDNKEDKNDYKKEDDLEIPAFIRRKMM